ncbi:MAG TPA: helix-turn-helix transcriptional regulator [Chloroflexota bacterium]
MVKLYRLKNIRERRALTQQDLAERAGVNRVTVARLEGGVDQPLPGTVRKLADALGVAPEELMDQADLEKAGLRDAAAIAYRTRPRAALPARLAVLANRHQLEVRDADDVTRVLGREAGLADLIADAADQLPHFFPDASATLEVVYDPEYEDDGQLFMGIRSSLPRREAFEVLDKFDKSWWLYNVRRANGLLIIDLAH